MKKNNTSIVALKGIAAIIIAFIYHYRENFSILGNIFPFANIPIINFLSTKGYLFVELFFIISGILFILAYHEKIKNEELDFHKFIMKKIKSIFPLMIISILFMGLLEFVYYYKHGNWWYFSSDIWSIFTSLTGTSIGWYGQKFVTNAPIWYISILFQCYIISFIISKFNKKLNNIYLYILVILIGLSIQAYGINIFIFNAMSARGCTSFFIGCILGFIIKHKYLDKYKLQLTILSLLNLIVIPLIYYKLGEKGIGNVSYILQFIIYPSIIYLSFNNEIIKWILERKIFQFFGKISFSIYIWNIPLHLLTLMICEKLKLTNLYGSKKFFVFYFLLSIILSTILYYLVENNINKKLKQKEKK
jgi:hypothetical protein